MQSRFRTAAAFLFATALGLGPGLAADYTTIVQETGVDRPADEVWKQVGGYCDIAVWMKTTCAYTAGTGDVGTVRVVREKFVEVMVAKTGRSYTYATPGSTYFYHGTLAVEPDGPTRSKIIYTVLYDQASPDAPAREQRAKIFADALQTMKGLAEGR